MSKVKIVVTPTGIKSAISRAAAYLNKLDYDTLFLNLSRELEGGVRELAEGAPYEMVLERFIEERLVCEPVGVFKSEAEPILKAVRGIANKKPNLEVYCYKDPSSVRKSLHLAVEVMLKIFRLSSTGRIDLEEWKRLVYSWLTVESEAALREADYIAQKLDGARESLCLSGFDGRGIKRRLKERGYKVDLEYTYFPYHFTPLEVLFREARLTGLKERYFTQSRMRELIEQHGRFIRDYVVPSEDYDEAYRRWVFENVPWIKRRVLSSYSKGS